MQPTPHRQGSFKVMALASDGRQALELDETRRGGEAP
jgi:hypothetical protein